MTTRQLIALVVAIIVLPALLLWLLVGHPTTANAANYGTQVHRDKTHTELSWDALTGIHLFSITQELVWDGGKSDAYPYGRVYNVTRTSKPWVNTADGYKYDGIVADNSGWKLNRFEYVFDRTYEFHICLMWYCQYSYPEIEQIAYADGTYQCFQGTDPNNLKAC